MRTMRFSPERISTIEEAMFQYDDNSNRSDNDSTHAANQTTITFLTRSFPADGTPICQLRYHSAYLDNKIKQWKYLVLLPKNQRFCEEYVETRNRIKLTQGLKPKIAQDELPDEQISNSLYLLCANLREAKGGITMPSQPRLPQTGNCERGSGYFRERS